MGSGRESISGGWGGTGLRRSEVLEPGHVLEARYELLERIGEGAFGEVWRAIDRRLGIHVAIKVAKGAAGHERFEEEIALLAKLQHPGIVRIRDRWTSPASTATPFFVMDYCHGTLKEWIATRADAGGEDPDEVLSIFLDVCRAVDFVHEQGTVHRDLKPSNVLLLNGTGRPSPVLADFGVAKRIPLDGRTGSLGVGTDLYHSPEQGLGLHAQPSPASDVFALAVILFEMLTGEPTPEPGRPFWKIVVGAGADAPTTVDVLAGPLCRALPGEAPWIVARALSYAPGARPSAAELGEGVVRLARARSGTAGQRRVRPVARDPMALAIATSNGVGYLFAAGRPVLLDPQLPSRIGYGARHYPQGWLVLPLCGAVFLATALIFRRFHVRTRWWVALVPLVAGALATIPILRPEVPHGALVSDIPVWAAFTGEWLAVHYAFNASTSSEWRARSPQTQKLLFTLFVGALVGVGVAPIPIMLFLQHVFKSLVTDPADVARMEVWGFCQIGLWALLWLVGPTRELGVAWCRTVRARSG